METVSVALLTAPVTVDETVPRVHLNVLPDTPSADDISLVLPLQKLSKRPWAFVSEKQKTLIKKMVMLKAILLLTLN